MVKTCLLRQETQTQAPVQERTGGAATRPVSHDDGACAPEPGLQLLSPLP